MEKSAQKFWNEKSELMHHKSFNSLTDEEKIGLTFTVIGPINETLATEDSQSDKFL